MSQTTKLETILKDVAICGATTVGLLAIFLIYISRYNGDTFDTKEFTKYDSPKLGELNN